VTPAVIGVNNAAQLISAYEWGPGGGTAVSITYSFLTSVPSYYAPSADERRGFSAFTPEMQDGARMALAEISTFANVTFTEVAGVGDITFGMADLSTSLSSLLAWAYYPDQAGYSGDVWFNNNGYLGAGVTFSDVMAPGDTGFYVTIHELGHSLGLMHSFDAGLTGAENTEQFTVMAYDTSPWGSIYASTHMLYDISALQAIYGANTAYNSGDTVYNLDPAAAYTVWDGGGIDTFDASALAFAVTIRLEEGAFSSVGLTNNIAVAYGTVIENAVAGAGNDFLYGNGADNILSGGAGNDYIDGAGGNDTADYSASVQGVRVDLLSGTATGGDAQGDTLIAIENLIGSDQADWFWGDAGANILKGLAGADMLEGGAGADIIDGGAGWDTARYIRSGAAVQINLGTNVNTGGDAEGDLLYGIEAIYASAYDDTLVGGAGNDVLNGGWGNDTISGGAGNDILKGAAGNDTADYSASVQGVRVDLLIGTATGGDAQGDTLIDIENVTGSDQVFQADWLWGDNGDNVLRGLAGADMLEGGAGADIIEGGAGWDTARYIRSGAAVQINLATNVNTGGDAEGDLLYRIEAIYASAYDDTLVGGAGNDVLNGGWGNDTISGGAGNDILKGSSGEDALYGDDGADLFVFEAGSAFNGVDTVGDFSLADGDALDISSLLSAYDALTDLITDFVRITDSGGDSVLSVDIDGGADAFTQIALLLGVSGLTDEAALESAGNLITA
jgi:Ca2+-binding RTX toxin-like protein